MASNPGNPNQARGGDHAHPGRFSETPGAVSDIEDILKPETHGAMHFPADTGKGDAHGYRLDADHARNHIKARRDAQRDAAIKHAKDSGSEEAMGKAEQMMTGAEVVREIPNAIRDGKRTPVRVDEMQKCERREIVGDKVTVCVKRMLKTRKSAEDDESTISTAFPPDEKYAAAKRIRHG